jgi:hypothetical protein
MDDNYYGVGKLMPGGSWLFSGIYNFEEDAVDAIRDLAALGYWEEVKDLAVIYPVRVDEMAKSGDIYFASVLYRPLCESRSEGIAALKEYKKSVDEAW